MTSDFPAGLREQQLVFANYLRNPSSLALLDVEPRRMRIYRELFFGNISQLLASSFPVIRSICSDEQWTALVSDFYACHRSETPLFPYVACEFVDYLINERNDSADFPFLKELAQYEWSEIALRHMSAVVPDLARACVVSGTVKPVITPLCFPMVFQFPVHRIGKSFIPVTAPAMATYLLVYRDRQETVRFIESSAATFRLLQLLGDETLPDMSAVIASIAREMGGQNSAGFHGMIVSAIEDLVVKGVLFYQP